MKIAKLKNNDYIVTCDDSTKYYVPAIAAEYIGSIVTAKPFYERLCKILTLAFAGDDIMDQDNLFKMQDELADIVLEVANKTGNVDDLVKKFPWLYKAEEKGSTT